MTNKLPELLPCPFCGSNDLSETQVGESDEETFAIECNQCFAMGGYYGGNESTSPDEAAQFWNTRPTPPADAMMKYSPELYNAEMDELEFCVRDCHAVTHRIDRQLSVLKTSDGEIVGFKIAAPMQFARALQSPAPVTDAQREAGE